MKRVENELRLCPAKGLPDNGRSIPEEALRSLVNSLPAYLYSARYRDGFLLDAVYSPRCEIITGYRSAAYRRDPALWLNMVHPQDQESVRYFVGNLASQPPNDGFNDKAFMLEYRIMHKEGVVRWVTNRIVVSREDKAETLRLDGLVMDITDQRAAEVMERIREPLFPDKGADRCGNMEKHFFQHAAGRAMPHFAGG